MRKPVYPKTPRAKIALICRINLLCLGLAFLCFPTVSGAQSYDPVPKIYGQENADSATPLNQKASPEDEAIAQGERAEFRRQELQAGGFKWIPWLDAGEKVWNFVQEREQTIKETVGDGKRVDVAIYDLDKNGEPDILVNFWDDDFCSVQGCAIYVFKDGKNQKVRTFIATSVKPFQRGIKLDNEAYFSM